ncbi:hypothetical protein F4775DRAFT_449929 [Biscogniauxia sp. FL1348]|nr:hypothetical protein F4775DRAFT_449929 [Biscogniauxia sp. FL1348]
MYPPPTIPFSLSSVCVRISFLSFQPVILQTEANHPFLFYSLFVFRLFIISKSLFFPLLFVLFFFFLTTRPLFFNPLHVHNILSHSLKHTSRSRSTQKSGGPDLFLIAPNNECVSPITHFRGRRRLRLGRVSEDWTIGPSEGNGRRVLSDMPRYVFPVPTQCLLCCATCSSLPSFCIRYHTTSYTTHTHIHERERERDTHTHTHTDRQADRRTYTYLPTYYLHMYIPTLRHCMLLLLLLLLLLCF